MSERARPERTYLVHEHMVTENTYEVTATSKAAAIEKAKAGEYAYEFIGGVRPTGTWTVERKHD